MKSSSKLISSSRAGVSKVIVAIIIVAVAAFIGLVTWALINKSANEVDYSKYDFNTIIAGNEDNGNIADHVKGDPEAPVKIFEYADYQCPGCSSVNPKMNKLVEKYNGKLAVVYRNFLLSYHQNGTAAASAAEAAAIQGYWKEYADKLFTNQSSWEYADPEERTEIFAGYFEKVTNGKGDVEKFKQDMASAEVKKKIDFDMGIASKINVPGTPSLYIDGERIDFSRTNGDDEFYALFRKKINAKLMELGQEVKTTDSSKTSADNTK